MKNIMRDNLTAGVISPAWIPNPERMEKGLNYLAEKGIKVINGEHLGKEYGYFAGSDEERVSDLHRMFADPEVDLILCARGGWGGLRLVDHLNYELIRQNPKLLVGYSDITTLQLAIWKKCSIPSFSGPMVGVEMGKGIVPFTEQHFWGQVYNNEPDYHFSYHQTSTSVLKKGEGKGRLLGGCMSLVCHLLGTEFSPDYRNSILFLEDVGEKPYKIDRYLAHLKQAGIFDQIEGLILGDFIDCEPEEGEKSFKIEEIFASYFSSADFPVLVNFPYGHGDFKFTMPIGVDCILSTETHELILENPFKRGTA